MLVHFWFGNEQDIHTPLFTLQVFTPDPQYFYYYYYKFSLVTIKPYQKEGGLEKTWKSFRVLYSVTSVMKAQHKRTCSALLSHRSLGRN